MKTAPSVMEESHRERFSIDIDGKPFVPSADAKNLADVLKEIQENYSNTYIILSAKWNDDDVPEDLWALNKDVLIGCFSISMQNRIEFFPEKLKASLAHIEHFIEEFDRILHLKNEDDSGVINPSDWKTIDDFQAFAEWITTIFDLDAQLKSHFGEKLSACWEKLFRTITMFSEISQEESGFIFKRETRREIVPLLEAYRTICREAFSICC